MLAAPSSVGGSGRERRWLALAVVPLVSLIATWRWAVDLPLLPEATPVRSDAARSHEGEAPVGRVAVPVAPLHGVVVDRDGRPVADAEVAAVVLATGTNVSLRTDAAGVFAFAVMPKGELQLVVVHTDFVVRNETVVESSRGGLRLMLQHKPRLRGRALDAVTGRPLRPFVAALLPLSEGVLMPLVEPPPTAVRIHRADGLFELVADQGGPHAVQVFSSTSAPAQLLVQLAPDRVDECELRVARGVRVRGRVRDASGNPVADASVSIRCHDGATAVAATLADGSFALVPLPQGDVALLVQPMALPFLAIDALRLDVAEPSPFFELQLPAGAEVTGTVTPWRAGQQAEIELRHRRGPLRRVTVDAETGAFAARELTPGQYRLHVERTEPVWRSRVARMLQLGMELPMVEAKSDLPTRVELHDLTDSLARVRGRIDGQVDLDHLVVRALREDEPMPATYEGLLRAAPQADGSFEIDGLTAGRWRLQLMRGNDVLHWQTLAVDPAAQVEVVLRAR